MASVNSPMFVPGQAMAAARTQGPSTGASKRFFLRRSFGGGIPGSGNSDTVPAMLTPGEFVVNKEATAKHLPLLHQINQTKSNSQTQSGRYALGDLVRRFAGISAEHMPIAERIIASNPAKARPLNYIQTIGVEPKLKFTRDSSGIMMDSLMNQRLKESNKGFVSGQEVWAAIEAAGPAATSVLRSQAATFAVSGGGIPRVDAVMDTLKAKLLSQKGSVKDNLFGKLFAESLLETGQQDFAMALAKPYMLDSAMPMAPRNLYDRIIGSGFSAVPDSAELRNILAMPTGGARLQLLRPLVSPGQVVFEQRSGRANIYLNDGQDFFNLGNLKGEIGADAANPFGYKNHMRGVPKNQNLVYAHAGLGEEFARLGLVRHMSDGGGPVFLGQPQSSRETALALGRQAALTRAHEDMTTGQICLYASDKWQACWQPQFWTQRNIRRSQWRI
jgi:hypothetical protein